MRVSCSGALAGRLLAAGLLLIGVPAQGATLAFFDGPSSIGTIDASLEYTQSIADAGDWLDAGDIELPGSDDFALQIIEPCTIPSTESCGGFELPLPENPSPLTPIRQTRTWQVVNNTDQTSDFLLFFRMISSDPAYEAAMVGIDVDSGATVAGNPVSMEVIRYISGSNTTYKLVGFLLEDLAPDEAVEVQFAWEVQTAVVDDSMPGLVVNAASLFTPIPEPSTGLLVLVGMVALAGRRSRRCA